jgi:hypothetical protein
MVNCLHFEKPVMLERGIPWFNANRKELFFFENSLYVHAGIAIICCVLPIQFVGSQAGIKVKKRIS